MNNIFQRISLIHIGQISKALGTEMKANILRYYLKVLEFTEATCMLRRSYIINKVEAH